MLRSRCFCIVSVHLLAGDIQYLHITLHLLARSNSIAEGL